MFEKIAGIEKDRLLNQWLKEELDCRMQGLITEAIEAWDRCGRGCFGCWVKGYVMATWLEMVRKN